jgi:hypothetical protein
VRELKKGTSTIAFDYRIVAKRKGYEQARLAKVADAPPEAQIARVAK